MLCPRLISDHNAQYIPLFNSHCVLVAVLTGLVSRFDFFMSQIVNACLSMLGGVEDD